MNNEIPKIRFKGFDTEWVQFRAGDIFKSISDKNHENLPVLSATQDKGMVYRDEVGINITYDEKSKKNYKRVTPDQFVIHLRSFQGGFAYSDKEGITSPAYTILDFKKKDENSPLFWKEVLRSSSFIKRLETVTYGIRDGRSISYSDFSTLNFYSSTIKEQQKIGVFFKQLDDTIDLQKKLIEQKQQYKKAMLQRMFPQKGESVPKVRFKEFKGDWENATLEDIVDNIGTGKSKYSIHSKSEQTPYEILGSTSIIGYDNDFDYDGDFILTARVGANAGTLYKYAGKVKITDNTVFIKSENLNFIYYLLVNFELKKLAFGTGQPLIKSSELKKLELKIPMLKEEQKKIGTFFKQLDDTIALHQKRLEGYQNFKKTLLQRMFV